MIKNKIILALIIAGLLSPVLIASAVENVNKTATPTIAEKQKESVISPITEEQKINNLKELSNFVLNKKIDERKNEKKKVLSAKSKNIISPILAKVYKNLEEKIKKIEVIDSKFSARISILEKEGKDVTTLKEQYNIAKFELTKTKVYLLTAATLSVKQITTSTSKGIIRDLVKEIENNIKKIAKEYKKLLPMFAQLEGDNSFKK